jgi:D-alanyl-lipoteichoic acid acyltransferase DltB (MBOAT superfamily)
MLFNSFAYICLFLPVVAMAFHALCRLRLGRVGLIWLVVASLGFYAWSAPRSLPILAGSILFNFAMGRALGSGAETAKTGALQRRRKLLLFAGVAANLVLLGYFKYFDHLPLGISFFTLMQVMYLVDVYERLITPSNLLEHTLSAAFFPTVTMGPLMRVGPFRAQLYSGAAGSPDSLTLAKAITLFAIGLFKKVVLADGCARLADAGFASPATLSMFEGWASSLSFALQLYYDFSGYSDMALASALMLGLNIPVNFNSPYQARSIVDFWRRWHISLSNFITTYLYTPIVRSFKKLTFTKAMLATLVSMIIVGIWHGSTWNFVIFGALHGIGLVVNQVWKKTKRKLPGALAWILTIIYLNLAFVFFRAPNLHDAWLYLGALVDVHAPLGLYTWTHSLRRLDIVASGITALAAAVIVVLPKNSMVIVKEFRPSLPRLAFAVCLTLVSLLFLNSMIAKDFLYIDF